MFVALGRLGFGVGSRILSSGSIKRFSRWIEEGPLFSRINYEPWPTAEHPASEGSHDVACFAKAPPPAAARGSTYAGLPARL